MAKAPSKAIDFDGFGNVWFKIFEITAHADPTGTNYPTFPANSESSEAFRSLIIFLRSVAQHQFQYPKERSERAVSIAHSIRSSEFNHSRYPLRVEHIALHDAYYFGGAQFYIAGNELAGTRKLIRRNTCSLFTNLPSTSVRQLKIQDMVTSNLKL
jgi:hypothetical protein